MTLNSHFKTAALPRSVGTSPRGERGAKGRGKGVRREGRGLREGVVVESVLGKEIPVWGGGTNVLENGRCAFQ